MATTAYHPRLRAVRMTSAKNGILLTIIDDFFDAKGSMNELTHFTDAVERYIHHIAFLLVVEYYINPSYVMS